MIVQILFYIIAVGCAYTIGANIERRRSDRHSAELLALLLTRLTGEEGLEVVVMDSPEVDV